MKLKENQLSKNQQTIILIKKSSTKFTNIITSITYTKSLMIFATSVILSLNTFAGIEKLVGNVMPQGTMSNFSKSAVVKDQLGGHFIGGSVVMKTPTQDDLSLANFTPPTCKMGGLPCNAHFDMRMGALSYISSAEMMRAIKSFGQNVGAYGSMMLVKTVSPQVADLLTWLEGVQRDISDKLNINCERMMAPITGTIDRLAKSAEANRQSNLVMNREGRDSAEIVQNAKKDSNNDPVDSNQELKSQLGENFNLVWKALEKKAEKSTDAVGLKELLMSISGTIVIKKGEAPRVYSSLINEELIEQYMGVGSGNNAPIKLYSCDENNKCLNPTPRITNISRQHTLYGQIDKILTSMIHKIKSNKDDFSEEEENLIALSTVPLVSKIEMDLAIYADSASISVRAAEFIEHLCYDVVTKHLTRLLQQTTTAVEELSYLQISDTGIFEKFSNNAGNIISYLSEAKATAFKRYDLIGQMKARLRQDESYFEMKFEEYLSSNNKEG